MDNIFKTAYQALAKQYQALNKLTSDAISQATQLVNSFDALENQEIPSVRGTYSITTDEGRMCQINVNANQVTFRDAGDSNGLGETFQIATINDGVVALDYNMYEDHVYPGIGKTLSQAIDDVCDSVGANQLYTQATQLVLNGSYTVEGFKAQIEQMLPALGERASDAYVTIISALREDGLVTAASQLLKSVYNQIAGGSLIESSNAIQWARSDYDVKTVVGIAWDFGVVVSTIGQLLLLAGNAAMKIIGAVLMLGGLAVSKVTEALNNVNTFPVWNTSAGWCHYAQPLYQGTMDNERMITYFTPAQINLIRQQKLGIFDYGPFVIALWAINDQGEYTEGSFNFEVFLNATVDGARALSCVQMMMGSWNNDNDPSLAANVEGTIRPMVGADGSISSYAKATAVQYFPNYEQALKPYLDSKSWGDTASANRQTTGLWAIMALLACWYLGDWVDAADYTFTLTKPVWRFDTSNGAWVFTMNDEQIEALPFEGFLQSIVNVAHILLRKLDPKKDDVTDPTWNMTVRMFKLLLKHISAKDASWSAFPGYTFSRTFGRWNGLLMNLNDQSTDPAVSYLTLQTTDICNEIGAKGNALLYPPEYSTDAKFNTILLGGFLLAVGVAATIALIVGKSRSRRGLALRQAKDDALRKAYLESGDPRDFQRYWNSQRRTRRYARRWGLLSQLTKAPDQTSNLVEDVSAISQSVTSLTAGSKTVSSPEGATPNTEGYGILTRIYQSIRG